MSKTILAEVKGFTPLIDNIVETHGIITAAVFGKVWRYCQGKDGVCSASQERLAKELHLSRRSIITHIGLLVDCGYLKDNTPGVKNRPHIYSDTGKAGLEITISATTNGVNESYSDNETGVNEMRSSVNEMRTHCELNAHEDSIKETIKESIKERERENEKNYTEDDKNFSIIVDAFLKKKNGSVKYPKQSTPARTKEWQEPIGDFLDFAGDPAIVIRAMNDAIDKQRADNFSTRTPGSIYKSTMTNIENILNPPAIKHKIGKISQSEQIKRAVEEALG